MLICQLNLFADGFFLVVLIKMIFTNLKKKLFQKKGLHSSKWFEICVWAHHVIA